MLFVKNLKDELIGWLGVAGIVLWYLIEIVVALTPLVFLNFPLWVNLIILFTLMSFQYVGGLLQIALWVWSFIVVIARPIDGWSIFYFVVFAIEFFTILLPLIANVVLGIFNLIREALRK